MENLDCYVIITYYVEKYSEDFEPIYGHTMGMSGFVFGQGRTLCSCVNARGIPPAPHNRTGWVRH